MISEIEERINEYSALVLSGEPPPPQGICPRCLKSPDYYKFYDCRIRFFLFIVGNLVRRAQSYLLRWKCPLCQKSFTDYPDFAIPHKHYVADDVRRLSSLYVEKPAQTYQGTVLTKEGGFSYEWEKDPSRERQLNKTTVWRWVGYLGRKAQELGATIAAICQRAPNHIACSRSVFIPNRKYRSRTRKRLLENAFLLLHACRILKETLGQTIFPRLATPAAYFNNILSAMG